MNEGQDHQPSAELKAELKRIVDFMNTHGEDGRALWCILSALRGPDNSRGTLTFGPRPLPASYDLVEDWKAATTAVIRHSLGIHPGVAGLVIHPDCKELAEIRCGMTSYSHFKDHALAAFEELGLDWYNSNAKEPEPARERMIPVAALL